MLLWLLESTALALSIFVTTLLLWLGLTVLFNGERGKPVVLLSSAGLLAAALFFFSHTMILGIGFTQVGLGMNFWWRLAWLPLPVAPYVWLLTVLRYADLSPKQSVAYRRWQIALGVGCASLILVFLFANPFPSYASLVYAHILNTPHAWWVAGVPLTLWLYLPYSMLCYLVPIFAFRTRFTAYSPHVHARPWLAAVSLILMSVGVVVGIIVAWAARQPGPLAEITRWNRAVLLSDDSVVLFLGALAVILLGRAIVGLGFY